MRSLDTEDFATILKKVYGVGAVVAQVEQVHLFEDDGDMTTNHVAVILKQV